MGAKASYVATRLLRLLGLATDTQELGLLFGSDCGYHILPMIPAVSGMRMAHASGAGDCPVTHHRKATIVFPRIAPSRPFRPTIWPVPLTRKPNSGWPLVSVWCGRSILTHIGSTCTATTTRCAHYGQTTPCRVRTWCPASSVGSSRFSRDSEPGFLGRRSKCDGQASVSVLAGFTPTSGDG